MVSLENSKNSFLSHEPQAQLSSSERDTIGIYLYIIDDQQRGRKLYKHLRCARKQRRKRYGAYDSRGFQSSSKPWK